MKRDPYVAVLDALDTAPTHRPRPGIWSTNTPLCLCGHTWPCPTARAAVGETDDTPWRLTLDALRDTFR